MLIVMNTIIYSQHFLHMNVQFVQNDEHYEYNIVVQGKRKQMQKVKQKSQEQNKHFHYGLLRHNSASDYDFCVCGGHQIIKPHILTPEAKLHYLQQLVEQWRMEIISRIL